MFIFSPYNLVSDSNDRLIQGPISPFISRGPIKAVTKPHIKFIDCHNSGIDNTWEILNLKPWNEALTPSPKSIPPCQPLVFKTSQT